ncbi:unnamed protein product [Sympodiomycopsis kandeliae]
MSDNVASSQSFRCVQFIVILMNRQVVARCLPTTRRSSSTARNLQAMSSASYQSRFAPAPGEKLTLSSRINLPNGASIPRWGIGTWEMRGTETIEALESAVKKLGTRCIDTAQYYRNEAEVGKFVKASKIPREELYVITKTFSKGVSARTSIERSLQASGLDYWDLVLIHAPDGGKKSRLETWKELSELVREGKVKHLGLSNYGQHHIQELIDSKPQVFPVTNQIECHPWFPQFSLRKYTESQGISVQAYCPLARGEHYDQPVLKSLSEKYGKTPAQIMLRWEIQSGMIPLPKSSNYNRQVENIEAYNGGWELEKSDMDQLDNVTRDGVGRAVEIQTMSQEAP